MFKELVRRIRQDFYAKRNWGIIWNRVKCFGICAGLVLGMIFLSGYLITLLTSLGGHSFLVGVACAGLFLILMSITLYLMFKIIEISVDKEDDILYPKWKDY